MQCKNRWVILGLLYSCPYRVGYSLPFWILEVPTSPLSALSAAQSLLDALESFDTIKGHALPSRILGCMQSLHYNLSAYWEAEGADALLAPPDLEFDGLQRPGVVADDLSFFEFYDALRYIGLGHSFLCRLALWCHRLAHISHRSPGKCFFIQHRTLQG